jgi:hypothetical protein
MTPADLLVVAPFNLQVPGCARRSARKRESYAEE